ncbi:hypothetical protein NDU88_005011 [Pleurodeles waltl]|uniref:Uncharacterized protein n=1 Tax=Pleurodeles waltl TaxID=8319 RepID=A0AAV7T970_PLEWA|nr:hypothetical protein NDU88_005011 [Pleurodeles waltl]
MSDASIRGAFFEKMSSKVTLPSPGAQRATEEADFPPLLLTLTCFLAQKPPLLALRQVSMAAYEDQGGDEYYVDDPAGSFEQDLVYALDADVRHTVTQALAQAIRPIKHHLIGFAEQKGWVAPSGSQMAEDPSLFGSSQALKPDKNLHAADFESLIRSLARDHDYNASSTLKSKSKEDLASTSSDHFSDQGDDPPENAKRRRTTRLILSLPLKFLLFNWRTLFNLAPPYGCLLRK